MILALLLAGCSDFALRKPDPPEPADPPGIDPDADFGQPPSWNDCSTGWYGQYFNLPVDHPDVEPEADAAVETDPEALDWWDADWLTWRKYDGTLDFGASWWPVDDGLEGDPAYFAVRWTAWIRAWSSTTLTLSLGSSDDSYVIINDALVASLPGVHPFEPETVEIDLSAGQYPIDVRMAQRAGEESAFRLRVLAGDVTICYPDFSEN